jgi:hypothetical protein
MPLEDKPTIWSRIFLLFLVTCSSLRILSLTLREERRLRVYEKGVLWGIFGPERDEVRGSGENCIKRSFMVCTAHQIFFG